MADLDAREQLFLELINRARMDPLGEAARYGLANLNSGLAAGTISSTAKQVLAANTLLENSASLHSQDMIDRDYFAHETQGSGASPGDRMVAAGYGSTNSFGWGENLAWTGSTGSYNADAEVYAQHKNLFLSAGHRANTLKDAFEEVGIGENTGNFQGYNAMMTAQNFAYDTATDNFITGVSYDDTDNNDFYSIGEGQGGRTVSVYSGSTLLGSSTTTAAGGYAVETTQTGLITVVFSGGNLVSNYGVEVTLGSSNVKVDLVDGNTIETNFSATLTDDSVGLRLLGVENVDGTGNGLDNTLIGNSGANRLDGQGGNDTIIGGAGIDTAVYSGNRNDYTVGYSSGTQTFTLQGLDGSTDTVKGVEYFEFADGTLTAAQLQSVASLLRTVNVVADHASAKEGETGSTAMHFVITLSGASTSEQTLHYVIAGAGVAPADGSDISGTLEGTVTFAVGETSKSIEVLVLGDKAVEGNEAFAITLSDPSAGLALGTAAASFTIINDDLPPVVQTGTELNNTLRGTARVDEIYGLGGDDKLTGGSLGDELSGGAGNDTLDGGTGADHMRGGDDNDTYYVDNAGDIVDETGTTGTDTVISTISFSLVEGGQVLGAFENLTLAGRAVSATGNALDNIITGNTGANTLYGMDGADTLIGGRGADTLYGGNGDDKYYVDAAGDVVSEAGSDGTDTVYASVTFNLSDALHVFGDVENLVLTGKGSIKGTGNDLANTITGNSGANVLSGLGGNDILDGGAGNDTLEGGEGDDTLTGGAGRDIFVFMAAGFGADQITDFTDASDKLRISKSLALSIADLTISGNGTADIDISIGADTIHLHGAAPITLDAADFLFV